jgi:hypothetical protein
MSEQGISEASRLFFRDLTELLDSGYPPISPMGHLSTFRHLVELSSRAIVKDGLKHCFRYGDFGCGWEEERFTWFLRHLTSNVADIGPTRKLMLCIVERNHKAIEELVPWIGGEVVPL